MDEEETLTLVDTTTRVRAAFDIERITKRFYEDFQKKHDKFLSFINGIPDEGFQRWYASVMLNRLMFIYFLQKKNFLDGDNNYLRNRLKKSKEDKNESFYKIFLCPLFFEGFAKKEKDRSPASKALLGKIPYLNGGLFLKHQVEERYGDKIEIPDQAFVDLFEFFDSYQWNLDERPLRQENEINPDVLGYIFEKYINQKQMGAYYTKEDITEYISKNTIIPWLFQAASKKCEIAFTKGSYLWNLLQADPDKYIYAAVRYGAERNLPKNITVGLNDTTKRTDWNKSALEEYALPTETWREVISRRKRYEEIKSKIKDGQITSIEDFITYNLDIRQFARDVIDGAEGPELVRAFWRALEEITVLDPACGSGAFLFAGLNILEDLYEACLGRMKDFVSDLEASNEGKSQKLKDFREILERISSHSNEKYFIYKSIIISNLFGVDIMEEATEICKLRLFLKLAAQLESSDNIEPLPDIDFNIKAGNSLIGYTSEADVRKAVESRGYDFDGILDKIRQKAVDLDALFLLFRRQQTELGGEITPEIKDNLRSRLRVLEEDLNRYLAKDYGLELDKNADLEKSIPYQAWKSSHKPFHWWIEFYGIIRDGGFDAIIGNPPYVEYSKVQNQYQLKDYRLLSCGNLYAYFCENNLKLISSRSYHGMIIPHSAFCTDRMSEMIEILPAKKDLWISTYSIRPAKLFSGVDQRLAIYICGNKNNNTFSGNYYNWAEAYRPCLFNTIGYADVTNFNSYQNSIIKVQSDLELNIVKKIFRKKKLGLSLQGRNNNRIFFHNAPRYWIRGVDFEPYFWNERDGKKLSVQMKSLYFSNALESKIINSLLNSSLFFWWFIIFSDSRHLNLREIENFCIDLGAFDSESAQELSRLSAELMKDYQKNCKRKEAQYKATGKVIYDEYYPRQSKTLIDQIDTILAKHYGFTDEELDFIINYDIKYRLGADDSEDADE